MNYIRSCENCKAELRFPVDRGAILVKCPRCGASFIMDPDNPDSFLHGKFETFDTDNTPLTDLISDIIYLPVDFFKTIGIHKILTIKNFIKFFLFFVLFLYILRGCPAESPAPETETKQHKSPAFDI